MLLENLILDPDLDPQLLGGEPAFEVRTVRGKTHSGRGNKRGKRRRTEVPNEPMRVIHQRLKEALRELEVPMFYATGCRPGDRPRRNVERHRQSRFFCLLDLRDAYHQVDLKRLAEILCQIDSLDLSESFSEVQEFLERYCSSRFGGLPQGAPSSQDLFNIYCAFTLDEPLAATCEREGYVYSRYVDDLTISGSRTVSRRVRRQIFSTLWQVGFAINTNKYHLHDLRDRTLVINGIGLELGGRMFVPRGYMKHLSGLLHRGLTDPSLKHQVAGAMGVFRELYSRRNPTMAEKRILKQYAKFRHREKEERTK